MRRTRLLVAAALVLVGALAVLAPTALADGVKEGQKAANVALKLSDGSTVKLHDVKQPLVLFFYPKDFTGGWTIQVCAYRDRSAAFEKAGAKVIGISFDDATSHERFRSKNKLPFALATDDGSVSKAFGVRRFGRDTIVLDADAKVVAIMRGVSPRSDPDKALEVLAKLKGKK